MTIEKHEPRGFSGIHPQSASGDERPLWETWHLDDVAALTETNRVGTPTTADDRTAADEDAGADRDARQADRPGVYWEAPKADPTVADLTVTPPPAPETAAPKTTPPKATKTKKKGKRRAGRKRRRRLTTTVVGGVFIALLAPVVVQSWGSIVSSHFDDKSAQGQAKLDEKAADSDANRQGKIREADQRDNLYRDTRVADGQLIRTEAAYKTALVDAPAHVAPGFFLPQVENIRLARNALYSAKDRLSTSSSVAVFCAAARVTRAHAIYADDLVSAGIAHTHQDGYDLDMLDDESDTVAKKSAKLRDLIRNESGVLTVATTQQPIRDCRPGPRNGGKTS